MSSWVLNISIEEIRHILLAAPSLVPLKPNQIVKGFLSARISATKRARGVPGSGI